MDRSRVSRVFGFTDQLRFAVVSGDFNPINLDPVGARRTQAGTCIVHGVHVALWALDALIGPDNGLASIAKLKVQFHKFIPVGKAVVLDAVREIGAVTRAKLFVDDEIVVSITISEGPPAG